MDADGLLPVEAVSKSKRFKPWHRVSSSKCLAGLDHKALDLGLPMILSYEESSKAGYVSHMNILIGAGSRQQAPPPDLLVPLSIAYVLQLASGPFKVNQTMSLLSHFALQLPLISFRRPVVS